MELSSVSRFSIISLRERTAAESSVDRTSVNLSVSVLMLSFSSLQVLKSFFTFAASNFAFSSSISAEISLQVGYAFRSTSKSAL